MLSDEESDLRFDSCHAIVGRKSGFAARNARERDRARCSHPRKTREEHGRRLRSVLIALGSDGCSRDRGRQARAQFGMGGMDWGFMGIRWCRGRRRNHQSAIIDQRRNAHDGPGFEAPSTPTTRTPTSTAFATTDSPRTTRRLARPAGVPAASAAPVTGSQSSNAAAARDPTPPRPLIPIGSFFDDGEKARLAR